MVTSTDRRRMAERKGARLLRDTSHVHGSLCPFSGNCVDIHGLDRFLKMPRPAATHRSDASRVHRGSDAGID